MQYHDRAISAVKGGSSSQAIFNTDRVYFAGREADKWTMKITRRHRSDDRRNEYR
jgi:hypothetical protein